MEPNTANDNAVPSMVRTRSISRAASLWWPSATDPAQNVETATRLAYRMSISRIDNPINERYIDPHSSVKPRV